MTHIAAKERIGERYGKVIVTGIAYSDGRGKTMASVECDCGKSAIIRLGALVCGGTKSCGCESISASKRNAKIMHAKRPKDLKTHVKEFEWTMVTALMCASKSSAINHKPYPVEFSLNREQYRKLIDGECFYCGKSKTETRSFKKSRIEDSNVHFGKSYKCVGIDRIDSSKGYTTDNSISCCTKCNRMKLDLPQKEFIERCAAIARRHYGFR